MLNTNLESSLVDENPSVMDNLPLSHNVEELLEQLKLSDAVQAVRV